MPFYEYQCQACGAHHEALQKMSDAPLKKCPSCGKSKLTRLISAPVFRLKGGGWYETDFKSDQERKRNLAGDDAPPPAAQDKPLKTDKADTKAEAAKPATEGGGSSTAKSAQTPKRTAPKARSEARKPVKAARPKGSVKGSKGRAAR
jgi:putative FmdB family regulatory protein